MFRRRSLLVLTTALSALVGCGTAGPKVKVLGVSGMQAKARASSAAPTPSTALVVFVEVVNPMPRDLHLSRLQYRMAAGPWFETKGEVALSRELAAESAAVVEIPIPVSEIAAGRHATGPVPYELKGHLYSVEQRVERSWRVAVRGTIDLGAAVASGVPVRVRVAGAE